MTATYEWEKAGVLAGPPDFRFAGPGRSDSSVTIRVRLRDGTSWTAAFQASRESSGSVSDVFPAPDPHQLCVIEQGTAFLVDVRDPRITRVIPTVGPVRSVVPLDGSDLVMLSTHFATTALGESGVRWTTPLLSVDGITVEGVDAEERIVILTNPDGIQPRVRRLDAGSGVPRPVVELVTLQYGPILTLTGAEWALSITCPWTATIDGVLVDSEKEPDEAVLAPLKGQEFLGFEGDSVGDAQATLFRLSRTTITAVPDDPAWEPFVLHHPTGIFTGPTP